MLQCIEHLWDRMQNGELEWEIESAKQFIVGILAYRKSYSRGTGSGTAQCDGCRHCKRGWVNWITPLENRESVPCTCAAGQWLLSNACPYTKYSASQIEKLKRRSAQAVSNERSEE